VVAPGTQEYHEVVQEVGSSPVLLLAEAASRITATLQLADGHRSKLLGLLMDLVPVDELGEIAGEMELGG
jgi:hypothetical protein